MKRLLFFICLVLFSVSFGQKKFSTNEMINSFPFNKATTIKIISYNVQFRGMVPLPPPPNIASDSNALKKWEEAQKKPIDIKNIHKQKNLIGIDESKTLNLPEIHQLYNTIFNTCGKFMGGSVMGNKCFFPRNAVLFYDEDDKVFDIFEICFECDGLRSSTESSIFINDQCNKFYPELEKFFQSKGLQTQYTQK